MLQRVDDQSHFAPINRGFNRVFKPGRLSIGLVVPLDRYVDGPVPAMTDHLARARLAEQLGFAALWLRDVPFNVPSFGDAGQIYDPFVYLGLLAGQTEQIALGVASIILPLRHPAHVAKAASSVDVLSNGRLILGVASGDRPEEYPALDVSFADRGARFRESYTYIRKMAEDRPAFQSDLGSPSGGMDMLPKPLGGRLPLLVTGGSQQNPDWVAQHADGWMTYPRNAAHQRHIVEDWQDRVRAAGHGPKPLMQPLYVDLSDDPREAPSPIHLGFRSGVGPLLDYLKTLESLGVNHLALNLRFNKADIETTLHRISEKILCEFSE